MSKDHEKTMFSGMDDFQKQCRQHLIFWYAEQKKRYPRKKVPSYEETFIVWSCKTLQNMKCLVSTSMPDTIYAEYTYNGDKDELYEDIYTKVRNRAYGSA